MKRVFGLYRELPPALATEYLLRRVFGALNVGLHHYLLLIQEVPASPLLKTRGGRSAVEIREIEEGEYRHEWFPRPEAVIRDRFRQGARCWVAFKESRAVGCQWLIPGPYEEDEVRCTFVPLPEGGAAWDFDIYVIPELRLSRLFLQLWDATNGWMSSSNIKWTASRVDALNQQSLRSHLRMRAQVVDSVWFLAMGRTIQIARWKGGFHMSFNRERRPRITVGPPQKHTTAARPK